MAEENHDATTINGSIHSHTNGVQPMLSSKDKAKVDELGNEAKEEQNTESVFQITVKLPHKPYEIQVMVSTQEQVQDLRQSIVELPDTFQYSCFHLEHNGTRVNDFVELSEVKGLEAGSEIRLIEDPYTEKEARMHMIRIRDLIGAAGDRVDTLLGISAGLSLHDAIVPVQELDSNVRNGKPSKNTLGDSHAMADYDLNAPAKHETILPSAQDHAPKTVKSISVSPWNPPLHHLRQKGHLLYLQLTTNEGEQHQITAHVSGFFVNKSSNSKFDPLPRPAPKCYAAHSLLALIAKLSPSFESCFKTLQEHNSRNDPLVKFQITNAIPSNPWLVSSNDSSLTNHQPDITRTQETYLMSGIENAETLRDWNEEFQSTRELPRESVQDRVFRERITSKLFADYNEAAARGAMMVARGEISPLNPTENRDAQIFVYNNIFFSFGADGVGTFTSEGGNDAARVAVGKDVTGVKLVNQLDIPGLFTPGTVVVDYLGKRLVAQSIVPGIFKQREPGENQIDYGGVEGRDVVAENEAFVPVFSKLSKSLRIKRHDVWDKEGKKHTLEGSVETKGLLGTDGRKYILDLYRLTPLDVLWLESYWSEISATDIKSQEHNYPHRMAVLRPELIEAYWRYRMGEYVKEEVTRRQKPNGTKFDGDASSKSINSEAQPSSITSIEDHTSLSINGERKPMITDDSDGTNTNSIHGETSPDNNQQDRIDISDFSLALNPDVYCAQSPQTEEEKNELARDEADVRAVCKYLRDDTMSELIHDLKEGDVGFPMDGQSLSRLLHKRGINVRYLGILASLAKEQDSRLIALNGLAIQEMIARCFKHIANRYMKGIPAVFASLCISQLLNCLLGADFNKTPKVLVDEDLQTLYPEADWSFLDTSPQALRLDIQTQVWLRYRYQLDKDWHTNIRQLQLLREVSIKLGLQLTARDYQFSPDSSSNGSSEPLANGKATAPTLANHQSTNGLGGKKKKKSCENESRSNTPDSVSSSSPTTFEADDIVNIAPIIKDASPKSILAEEALEAGRISMMQNQKELGQELLLESLSLYEQIYGILHPEVARVYHQLSMLYYQMDEKNAAVELAHKAVIVSERTLGLDSNETILNYLHLGLVEHANGKTKIALVYVRHALELWKMIFGSDHPDLITTINNAAVMLQHLKHYHDSRAWFEISLTMCEKLSGKNSIHTATLCFQLAQALALDQEAKGAVNRMKEAYSIFHARLGPDDRNTKESESWLEQLTQNAVSIAKHAKDVQARRLRRIQLTPRVTLGTRPQPQVGQSNADAGMGRDSRSSISMDLRSVDELMRFIEGGGDTTKRTPTKKRTTRNNPKRRGGAIGIPA